MEKRKYSNNHSELLKKIITSIHFSLQIKCIYLGLVKSIQPKLRDNSFNRVIFENNVEMFT